MKEDLQQALRTLEKNLKDIQSANDTVKLVRAQASEDIKLAGKVIQRIDSEIDLIDSHFNKWLTGFSESTKSTFRKFDNKASDAVKHMVDLSDNLKSHVSANTSSLSESNKLLFQKYEISWDKHDQELNRVFNKFEELKQTIDKLKREIKDVDFPSRLNALTDEMVKIENLQKRQTEKVALGFRKQGIANAIFTGIGVIIIIFELADFYLRYFR